VIVRAPGLQRIVKSDLFRKLWRYSMASVVAVVVTQVSFLVLDGLMRLDAVLASTLATTIATIPSYEMNRKWAWGKSGKSHLWKEVIPFWLLAIFGWAFSTLAVYLVQNYARHNDFSHLAATLWEDAVYFAAFGVLWVGKFMVFNKLLFAHRPEHDRPAEAAAL